LARSLLALVKEGLKEYTEELFDLSKCDMGKKPDDISAHEPRPPTPQVESTPAGPSKSKTVASKAAHELTPPTAPMGSTSAGPSKSKTVASKATHETPPATYQMESTPAGPSKSPSKLKAGMSKVKKVAKQLSPTKSKRHSASQAGHSQAEPHSTSQAGPSQAEPHTTSHSGPSHAEPHSASQAGPSHANPHPAPHTTVTLEGHWGYSHLGWIPTLYIRKW